MNRRVLCYAHGRPDQWEAICLDLDISVQGNSFDDVRNALCDAIDAYVEQALTEDAATRRHLLTRKAPLSLRLKLAATYFGSVLFRRDGNRECRAGFDLPCPA